MPNAVSNSFSVICTNPNYDKVRECTNSDFNRGEKGLTTSVSEKMLDGIAKVILMNERLTGVPAKVAEHQQKLENLTERIFRLETALEIGLSKASPMCPEKHPRQIESKD